LAFGALHRLQFHVATLLTSFLYLSSQIIDLTRFRLESDGKTDALRGLLESTRLSIRADLMIARVHRKEKIGHALVGPDPCATSNCAVERGVDEPDVAARRSMHGPGIAEKREDPGFVENAPMRDAVPEGADGDVNVISEARGEIAMGPATSLFQFLGEIPMIEGAEWADFGFEERIGEMLVVVEAFRIGCAAAIGLDARPGNGETVACEI
jgi:hypothetical protein